MVFGAYIVAYLFLAGAGAAAFLVAAIACMWDALRHNDASEKLARTCQVGFFAAPCLMVLSTLFLLLDLGNAQRAWLVFAMAPQSVLSVGAWLVTVLVVVSGVVAVCGATSSEVARGILWTCCMGGALCALGVMGYTGLLLSDMVSIDLWHTPWLIVLFVVSSLSCGIATIVALDAALAPPSYELSGVLWRAGAVVGGVEVAVLVVFFATQMGLSETARASCEALLSGHLAPVFWGGVCVVGVGVPLMVHTLGPVMGQRVAMLTSSLGVLVGGVFLRYAIVAAASFAPLALAAI